MKKKLKPGKEKLWAECHTRAAILAAIERSDELARSDGPWTTLHADAFRAQALRRIGELRDANRLGDS